MEKELLQIFNVILKKNGRKSLTALNLENSLRNDLGFDSLDLAELTVRIEDEFEVDIFEDAIIDKVSEVIDKIVRREN